MTEWIYPIVDRSALDLANHTKKAYFNKLDWDRIVNDISYIRQKLVDLGLSPPELPDPLSTQLVGSYSWTDKLNRVSAYLNEIKNQKTIPGWNSMTEFTLGKSGVSPNYEDLNKWEKNIELLKGFLIGYIEMFTYAGDGQGSYYCGDWKRGGLI